jgi:CarD family transcriptional regulator
VPLDFKAGDFVVYPTHGVGRIQKIDTQEVAGLRLELFVISFEKDKMILRVPTTKAKAVGMRKLSTPDPSARSWVSRWAVLGPPAGPSSLHGC